MPKEQLVRAVHTIQRDRISNFIKEAVINKSGCFYFSIIMGWQHLHPDELLDRRLQDQLLDSERRLGVNPREVISRVDELYPYFGLKVTSVMLTSFVNQSVEEGRKLYKIDNTIPMNKSAEILERKDTCAIIFWQPQDRVGPNHYSSLHGSDLFFGEERVLGNVGGLEGAQLLNGYGYLPTLVFYLRKA